MGSGVAERDTDTHHSLSVVVADDFGDDGGLFGRERRRHNCDAISGLGLQWMDELVHHDDHRTTRATAPPLHLHSLADRIMHQMHDQLATNNFRQT